jgi:hypothetical protein
MRALLSCGILLVLFLVGCDSQRLVVAPPPPHGGVAFPLPEGNGFVEALRQDSPDQPGTTRLVIYFLDAECKPLPTAPTAASFQPRGRKLAPVALKLTAGADPQKAGELASTSFSDPGDIVGVLSATIVNKPVSVAISVR